MPEGAQLAETQTVAKAEPAFPLVAMPEAAAKDLPVSPELSPRAAPAETAAHVSTQLGRNGKGAVNVLANIQAAYGNGYASEVISRLRESRNGEQSKIPDPQEQAKPAAAAPAKSEVTPAAVSTATIVATGPKAEPPKAPPPASAPPTTAPEGAVSAAPATPQAALAAPAPLPPKPEGASPVGSEEKEEKEGTEAAPASAEATVGAAPAEGDAATAVPPTEEGGAAPEAAAAEAAPGEKEGGKAPEGEPGAAAEEPAPEQKSPSSPEEDPAYQAVIGRAKAVAQKQGHNNPAQKKAADAQAAALAPANEVASQAAAAQVGKIAEQKPNPFDKAAFKAALMEKIVAITPKNLEEADDFKDKGKAGSIKGEVVSTVEGGKEQAQGGIKSTTEEPPDPSVAEPKEVTPLPPTEAGPPPPDLGAEAAAPKPKTEEEVSLQAGSQELDAATASDPPLDDELVANSNEPEFGSALDAKKAAQKDAAERPAEYRAEESAIVEGARQQAVGSADEKTAAMHAVREGEFAQIVEQQGATQTEDELKRAEVAQHIESIYNEAKQKVEDRLKQLDQDVNTTFDSGAEQARQQFESYVDERMRAYKEDRYSGLIGKGQWLTDKLFGMPDEVNVFYTEGRNLYLSLMDAVIDKVAAIVETGLTEAMAFVAQGQQKVQEYVAKLPEELKGVGQSAAENIQTKFDSLAQSVTDKKDQLVDSLAQKYVDNLKAIDARIDEMKAANRGLVDAALDAIKAVIETILKLKDMLLNVLAKAASVIGKIIKDPIGFLGNLVDAVKLGLSNFIANLGTHLKNGLMAWLFGAMAEAGITMPENFDLKGILSLVMQVLGLTYANIRARAVAIVGEPVVKALETGAEIFKILITEGPAGLWNYIKDQLGNLQDIILDGIKSFVMERIIIAGITWLIGLLNPAGAFIKACKAIYDIVMFFITRGSQIMSLVNAILDSMAAIASGALGSAAAAVENALAKAIPVVIGFLASLLGLGGISEKIREIIKTIQAPINKAIDWVINKAVALVKAVGGLFGGKKEEKKEDKHQDDPQKAAKITAGLADIDKAEKAYLKDGRISREDAEHVAATVKKDHKVFTSITVVDGGEVWSYDYTASPGETHTGEKKAEKADDKPENYELIVSLNLVGKPVSEFNPPPPPGYSKYQREDKWFIRRVVDDDTKYQRLGVDPQQKIVLGKGVSEAEALRSEAEMRKELGPAEPGKERHHLIPLSVCASHELVKEAIRSGDPPYGPNSGLVFLPKDAEAAKTMPGLPIHSGSHPKWSRHVEALLNAELIALVATHGTLSDVPKKALTAACKRVQNVLRGELSSWSIME
jgi:hypothetical protein